MNRHLQPCQRFDLLIISSKAVKKWFLQIQWQNIDAVGDQSSYITSITNNLKTTVPIIRDNLAHSRKYFTQFCIKFANSFIPKFIQSIYKCKPINTEGKYQILVSQFGLLILTLVSTDTYLINFTVPNPSTT